MISVSSVTMRYGSRVPFENLTTTFTAGRRYGLTGQERRSGALYLTATRRARSRFQNADRLGYESKEPRLASTKARAVPHI